VFDRDVRKTAAAGAAVALVLLATVGGAGAARSEPRVSTFPRYDHVFLLIEENHNYNQIIGNPAAPELNALARDYGLATRYSGVADPSEPNYVAMLGGSTFGISSDEPYFFPGQSVEAPNLMSQLDQAGLSWKGYFQGMPYAGYRGYCFPVKCNGIPDSDTQYVAKHNGIVNFKNMQTAGEYAKLNPSSQLTSDLASGHVPNLSYIVPDECHDMHGAPPWCVDSGKSGSPEDTELVASGDAFVGATVNAITSSPVWQSGNNAIVITFDEGNFATDTVPTVVVTNHGPRGVSDNTSYNHYSLLASIEQTFGLGCLQNSCAATPMTPLFEPTGSNSTPALPASFTPAPDGSNTVPPTGAAVKGKPVTLSGEDAWQVVPSPSIGNLDNNLAAVSAGSAKDAWAVGDYYNSNNPNVLENLGEHWDGSSWTAYPMPDVGPNENTLLGVSELGSGRTWAVGYFVNAEYAQRTLIEHWDGSSWQMIPSPNPGGQGDILYGVSAVSDSDVWAVGGQQDANGVWHPLAEHWNGTGWSVVPTPDSNSGGSLLYAAKAVSSTSVYATGQTGSGFPSQALVEHWNGSSWAAVNSPVDASQSLDPFGITATGAGLSIVGDRETDVTPYTTLVASGAESSLGLLATPNNGSEENDLFAATTAADGSTWAAGWYIDSATGKHETLTEHGVGGQWSLTPSPNPGAGENGLAGIGAVPGGGVWAVGISEGNHAPSTLIEFHH
jgi:Phosphoesterase family